MNRLLIFLLLLLSAPVVAQVSNPDSLFAEAKKKAEEKNYAEAISQVLIINNEHPENTDYAFFLAQLYYWTGANELCKYLLTHSPLDSLESAEKTRMLIGVTFSMKKYQQVIALCNEAIVKYPGMSDYWRLLRGLSLEKLNRNVEAIATLDSIPEHSYHWKSADETRTLILQKQKNTVSAGYMNSAFDDDRTPYQFAHIEYTRKIKRHSFVGRFNYANAYFLNDVQGEIELYNVFTAWNYLYLNVGFSAGGGLFPNAKLGMEYYHSFGLISSSLGVRYLDFQVVGIPLVTGHTALNFKNLKIEYRPYFAFNRNRWFDSHLLNARLFSKRKESWLQLELQYGGLPYYYFTGDITRPYAYRVGISACSRVKKNYFVQPAFMYEYEEYLPDQLRKRYYFQLILSKRF